MPRARVLFKRVYDGLGCSLAEPGELDVSFPVDDKIIGRLYIGPSPRYPVLVSEGERYLIPGGRWESRTREFREGLPEDSGRGRCFTEIICEQPLDVPPSVAEALIAQAPGAMDECIALVPDGPATWGSVADFIAGSVGLRCHPQFVQERLAEYILAVVNGQTFTQLYSSTVQLLEEPQLTQAGQQFLAQWLPTVAKDRDLVRDGIMLHWLLRAWFELDNTFEFMALFVAIERALAGYSGAPSAEDVERRRRISELIRDHGGDEAEELLQFYEARRPTLAIRFAKLASDAQQAGLAGTEKDISAFEEFNRARNLFLHEATTSVPLFVTVDGDKRGLEDITEHYVAFRLFGNPDVYTSRFRPDRTPDPSVPS